MNTKTKFRFHDLPKNYESLCRVFLPRPIHDKVDYANVVEMADAMALWRDDFTRRTQTDAQSCENPGAAFWRVCRCIHDVKAPLASFNKPEGGASGTGACRPSGC